MKLAARQHAQAPRKIAYLMVDDAPSKYFKAKTLFLRERGVPAVFFCMGKDMMERKNELAGAISEGFLVGNHSFSHRKFSDMPLQLCLKEIAVTHQRLLEIYQKAGTAPSGLLFRFPYLDKGGHHNSAEYFNSPFGRMFMNKGNGNAQLAEGNGSQMAYTDMEKKRAIQKYLGELGYAQPKFNGLAAEWYAKDGLPHDRDVIATYNSWEYAIGRQGQDAPAHIKDGNGVLLHVEMQWQGNGDANSAPIVHIPLIHDRKDGHIDSSALFRKIIDRMLEIGVEFLLPKFD